MKTEIYQLIDEKIGTEWETSSFGNDVLGKDGREWVIQNGVGDDLEPVHSLQIATFGTCGNYAGHKTLFSFTENTLRDVDGTAIDVSQAGQIIDGAMALPTEQDQLDKFEDSEGINVTLFIEEDEEDDFEKFLGWWRNGTGHGTLCFAMTGQGDTLKNSVYQFKFAHAGDLWRFGKAWGAKKHR